MKRPRQYIATGGRVKRLFPFLHSLTIFCTPAYAGSNAGPVGSEWRPLGMHEQLSGTAAELNSQRRKRIQLGVMLNAD